MTTLNKNKICLTLDIGGTHIRFGLFNQKGKLIAVEKRVVGALKSPNEIVHLIKNWVNEKNLILTSVIAGVPGIVNGSRGIVYASPHYPEWKNVPIGKLMRQALGVHVLIDNDANMIALGEMNFGAGSKFKSFIMLTLGTGIGGGLIFNRALFTGETGFAGEIGHIVVNPLGHFCACGSRGCLETYVSHSALKRYILNQSLQKKHQDFKAALEADWGRVSLKLAKKGHKHCSFIYREMAMYLAIGIANIANTTGVFNFVIGGGLSSALPLMKPHLMDELKRRIYNYSYQQIRIVKAMLGDKAGLLGCFSKTL